MPATALARCYRIAFFSENPYDKSVWFDNPGPASPLFQVIFNGNRLLEGTFGQYLTLSCVAGVNELRVITVDGGVTVGGLFIAPNNGNCVWISLYPAGSDPVLNAGGASGLSVPPPILH